MERLLDYRDPAMADIPYYCPVPVNRGTTLAHYLPRPERPRRAGDNRLIAVEVIDLLAGCACSQRRVPGVSELVAAGAARPWCTRSGGGPDGVGRVAAGLVFRGYRVREWILLYHRRHKYFAGNSIALVYSGRVAVHSS
jgi:hypothetical protein